MRVRRIQLCMVVEVFLYVDNVVWLESGGNEGRVYSRISRREKLWKEIFSSYLVHMIFSQRIIELTG